MFGTWRRRGQTTTEYILIVVLVAVLSIGIITVFGDRLRALFGTATKRLGGDDTAVVDTSDDDRIDSIAKQSLRDMTDKGN